MSCAQAWFPHHHTARKIPSISFSYAKYFRYLVFYGANSTDKTVTEARIAFVGPCF